MTALSSWLISIFALLSGLSLIFLVAYKVGSLVNKGGEFAGIILIGSILLIIALALKYLK